MRTLRCIGLTGLVIFAAVVFVASAFGILLQLAPLFTGNAWGKWKPEYANLDPAVQDWYRSLKSPKTTIPCCNEADGTQAEEDIRKDADGSIHYWTRFSYKEWTPSQEYGGPYTAKEVISEWMKVPDDVVIQEPTPNGAPVVFYGGGSKETLFIRCFVRGPGI